MTTWVTTVLYEDSAIGPEYPLHSLVLRMVADDTGWAIADLNHAVEGVPRKGIGNILREIGEDRTPREMGRLLVLVDRDRLHDHLDVAPSASRELIVQAFQARSHDPTRLGVFLLDPNLEKGLIRAAQGHDVAEELIRGALDKRRNDRDIVLAKAAGRRDPVLRDVMRRAQPGIDALVCDIRAQLEASGLFPPPLDSRT